MQYFIIQQDILESEQSSADAYITAAPRIVAGPYDDYIYAAKQRINHISDIFIGNKVGTFGKLSSEIPGEKIGEWAFVISEEQMYNLYSYRFSPEDIFPFPLIKE